MFLSSKRLLLKHLVLLAASLVLPKRLHGDALLWQTIAQVQHDLFPASSGVPTLKEIAATTYLKRVMRETRVTQEHKAFIRNGERWLNETSQEQYHKSYTALNASQRQALLQRISKESWGERWIATLLTYIMEAMLCDPVYGGNIGEVGWKWLHHTPGKPRPSKALV